VDAYLTGLQTPREARRDVGLAVEQDGGYRQLPGFDVVLGRASLGAGDDYRPAPGFPPMAQLDYVQKFSTVCLIVLGLLALVVFGIINPGRTARAVANVAKRRAGVD
jgi:hypothetical protein